MLARPVTWSIPLVRLFPKPMWNSGTLLCWQPNNSETCEQQQKDLPDQTRRWWCFSLSILRMTSSGSRGCDQGSDDQVGWASCPGIRPNVALSEKVYISLLPEGASFKQMEPTSQSLRSCWSWGSADSKGYRTILHLSRTRQINNFEDYLAKKKSAKIRPALGLILYIA